MSRIALSRIPDPRDRTPNQPAVLLQPDDIRNIGSMAEIVEPLTKEPQRWQAYINHVIKEAQAAGWGDVTLCGKQVLLIANVHLKAKDDAEEPGFGPG